MCCLFISLCLHSDCPSVLRSEREIYTSWTLGNMIPAMYHKYSSSPEHIRLYLDAIPTHIYTFCPLIFSLGSQIHNAAIWVNEILKMNLSSLISYRLRWRKMLWQFFSFYFIKKHASIIEGLQIASLLQLSSYSVGRMTFVVSEVVINISGTADCWSHSGFSGARC